MDGDLTNSNSSHISWCGCSRFWCCLCIAYRLNWTNWSGLYGVFARDAILIDYTVHVIEYSYFALERWIWCRFADSVCDLCLAHDFIGFLLLLVLPFVLLTRTTDCISSVYSPQICIRCGFSVRRTAHFSIHPSIRPSVRLVPSLSSGMQYSFSSVPTCHGQLTFHSIHFFMHGTSKARHDSPLHWQALTMRSRSSMHNCTSHNIQQRNSSHT